MAPITFITKPTDAAAKAEEAARHYLSGLHINKPLVVAVGGDGTMLQAVTEHLHQDVIFVGISAGSLGLLQTIEVDQLPRLAESIRNSSYHLLVAPLLSVSYCEPANGNAQNDRKTNLIGYAFNDISVERQESRAAKFKLKIDDLAGTFIGDGVIFATPLGSTAYSLAAGGPIIDSNIQDSFVVTPNNPHISRLHSSLQRPHVLNKNRYVRIELTEADKKDRPLQIALDGQIAAQNVTEPIHISVSDRHVHILQLDAGSIDHQIEEKRLGRI